MIPADKWPEWADRHCWDEGGRGFFHGTRIERDIWMPAHEYSRIPLPPGHDWRVPVMRAVAEQDKPVVWVSPEQLAAHKDRPAGEGGDYLPARLTCDGQFTQPLYAIPQPAQAIDLGQFREAVEALHAANIAQELAREPGYPSIQFQRTAQKCTDLMALIDWQSDPLCVKKLAECKYPKCDCALQPTEGEGE